MRSRKGHETDDITWCDAGNDKLHPKCIFVIKQQILNIKKLISLH